LPKPKARKSPGSPTRKPAGKPAPKSASKGRGTKSAPKRTTAPKAPKAKAAPKPAPKPTAKAPVKPPPKPAAKPPAKPVAKAPAKPAPAPVAPAKPAAPVKPLEIKIVHAELPGIIVPGAPTDAVQYDADGKPKPKGISIVQRPMKKAKPKKPLVMPSLGEPLLKPGAKRWKPLIASGPNAPASPTLGGANLNAPKAKTHLPKKELDRYRDILLRKRIELAGDVTKMEGEALQGSSGSLSHTPQHMADQGSDTYDQSLSLDLAQVDRNLIKEIDDALKRIHAGTFGVCEITGKPINRERLDELPWTRFSIEAARERERRTGRA
jgi:RNA polymerase-binding transcription factor DksA